MEEICSCSGKPEVKLMSTLEEYPLACMVCNLRIPKERLSLSDELLETMERWREIHDCIYRLWLDSGDYEQWAKDELADLKSKVNRQGLSVTKEIDVVEKCYFWCFLDADQVASACPSCSEPLTPFAQESCTVPQLVCNDCSIVLPLET